MAANLPCPCGSGEKYKKCCSRFHQGMAIPNALALMKARYSAYALGCVDFIMDTTHLRCSEYQANRQSWAQSIQAFSRDTQFQSLTILEFVDGTTTATVSFRVALVQGISDASFAEKSTFVWEGNRWLYRSGVRLNHG